MSRTFTRLSLQLSFVNSIYLSIYVSIYCIPIYLFVLFYLYLSFGKSIYISTYKILYVCYSFSQLVCLCNQVISTNNITKKFLKIENDPVQQRPFLADTVFFFLIFFSICISLDSEQSTTYDFERKNPNNLKFIYQVHIFTFQNILHLNSHFFQRLKKYIRTHRNKRKINKKK